MKKALGLSVFILFFHFSNAQQFLRFGLSGDISLSNINYADFNNGNLFNFGYGAFVGYDWAKFGVEVGCDWENMGAIDKDEELIRRNGKTKMTWLSAKYINFPLFLRYMPLEHITFMLGPSLAIQYNEAAWRTVDAGFEGITSYSYSFDVVLEDYFAKTEFRGIVGASYSVPYVDFWLKYSRSFMDSIIKTERNEFNSMMQIGVSIVIPKRIK